MTGDLRCSRCGSANKVERFRGFLVDICINCKHIAEWAMYDNQR